MQKVLTSYSEGVCWRHTVCFHSANKKSMYSWQTADYWGNSLTCTFPARLVVRNLGKDVCLMTLNCVTKQYRFQSNPGVLAGWVSPEAAGNTNNITRTRYTKMFLFRPLPNRNWNLVGIIELCNLNFSFDVLKIPRDSQALYILSAEPLPSQSGKYCFKDPDHNGELLKSVVG